MKMMTEAEKPDSEFWILLSQFGISLQAISLVFALKQKAPSNNILEGTLLLIKIYTFPKITNKIVVSINNIVQSHKPFYEKSTTSIKNLADGQTSWIVNKINIFSKYIQTTVKGGKTQPQVQELLPRKYLSFTLRSLVYIRHFSGTAQRRIGKPANQLCKLPIHIRLVCIHLFQLRLLPWTMFHSLQCTCIW